MWTYGDGSVRDQKSGMWGAVCGKSARTVLGGVLHLPDIDLEV